MNYLYSLICFLVGVFAFWFTYRDQKNIIVGLNLDFIIQIKGYLAGFGFIIAGILFLLNWFKN